MSWSVVVPTCRSEQFVEFTHAWAPLFEKHVDHLVIVQDLDGHDAEIAKAVDRLGVPMVELHHRGTIGAKYVPHGTDMIRSWGIYRAWKYGSTYTLTLDDDVRPHGDPFHAYEAVFDRGAPVSEYLNVGALTSFGRPLRGFPFKDRVLREVAVQYGGWHGVLDYDAPTQLEGVRDQEWFDRIALPVPRGAAVTGCIMNAAWRTKYAPIMWQLPMLTAHDWGSEWPGWDGRKCRICGIVQTNAHRAAAAYRAPLPPCRGRFNRFGDIWAGLFAKRVCDALDVAMVVNGLASVRHERASDPQKNLERETLGIPVNEELWDELTTPVVIGAERDLAVAIRQTYKCVTDRAAHYFRGRDPEYAEWFRAARDEWLGLFA